MDGGLILLSGITIASSLARHLAVTLWAVRALFGYCSCIELQNNMRLLPVRCLDSYSGKVGDGHKLLQTRARNAYVHLLRTWNFPNSFLWIS
jgi:hypothetical protein